MIGSFLVNPENQVAFAQFDLPKKLASLRVVPGPCCIAVLADGTEEMFTDELHSKILAAMKGKSEILVAHVGEDGKALEEYVVPLSIDL